MNTSLRRISVAIMALIVLLLANATLTQVFTADGLRSDPRNQRVLLDEYSRQRGQISAGGQLLAYSTSTNGHFRFLRVYQNPQEFAPVTGFYSLQYSSTGLERAEDTILNGSDERLFGLRGAGEGATDGGDRSTAIPQTDASVTLGDVDKSEIDTPCDCANALSNRSGSPPSAAYHSSRERSQMRPRHGPNNPGG